MHSMDRQIAWAGAILDRLMFLADERDEDAIAATAMELILPSVGMDPQGPASDNDP